MPTIKEVTQSVNRHVFVCLQVYQKLYELNVTVSHYTHGHLLIALGEKFDDEVHKWQVSFLPLLQSSVVRLIPYITITLYIDFLKQGGVDRAHKDDGCQGKVWTVI